MIEIKVRLYASLRSYAPELSIGQSAVLQMPGESTIRTVLDRLGIPHSQAKSCFLNGVHRELDYPLNENDELAIFPPVGGG